ncbi:MAG: hypothetical protein WCL06_06180 [Bacteroidota bacterium]
MKKIISTLLVCLVITGISFAQAPTIFKYQSIVRDNSGSIIASQLVKFRITLLKGSPTGTASYTEQHTTATNQYGLANLEIGNGSSAIGSIDTLQWGNADYFIKIELDPTGSSSFQVMGTTQLLSVPYALYANVAGNIPKIIAGSSDGGTSPNITSGSGFTITHVSTGIYDITFNTPFIALPTIVANCRDLYLNWIVTNITLNGFRIQTGHGGTGPTLTDGVGFSFVAIVK